MANSDDTITLVYYDEGVKKHHHRNGRWGDAFSYTKEGAEKYGDEDFEYETPLEMAIGTANTLVKRPGIDEAQVFHDGELERIVMQDPERNTVLDSRNNS